MYACAYNHCLHHGEKVLASASVVVGKKHYHWDCVEMKNNVKDCVDCFMELVEDKTKRPIVTRIINNLIFDTKIPTEFVLNKIKASQNYYRNKPPYVLYGLRDLWVKEVMNCL